MSTALNFQALSYGSVFESEQIHLIVFHTQTALEKEMLPHMNGMSKSFYLYDLCYAIVQPVRSSRKTPLNMGKCSEWEE